MRIRIISFVLIVIFSLGASADQGKALIGGHFDLIDQNGNPVKDEDFRDRLMLVYFGFSRCQMICPASLSLISEVMEELDEDAEEMLQPIFITVDPEYDTVEQLNEYHESFHPSILMLTGNEEKIKAAADKYRVYVDQDDYNNHSIFIYLMDRDGEYLAHFTYKSDMHEIIKKIKEFL
ncbi:SCO2-like protein [Rickettsiales bacterium]|nr:SCO2-like protein [Rickettsiales bacterium]